jgi:transcriptional regulator with XRE-family HTH domain
LTQQNVPDRSARRGSGGITLSDVAKLAGVSAITVSRALNTPDLVTPETREKVRHAVERTGYVPNLLAGGLASNRSRLVAAVVPTIAGPVFLETIQALTEALAQKGYQLMLGQSGYDNSREDALIDAIVGRRPDGIVLTGIMRHRSRVMQMGYDPKDWEGKPVIAIFNNWNDYNPCHQHFKQRVEEVKRGVLQAGGFPLELPTVSLGENLIKPSALLYRNMLAMEVEEMIRAYPGRRRGADGRLRQDHAGDAAGRDQRRPAGDLPAGRPDAARHVARPDAGLGLGRLQVLGRAPRRHHHRAAVAVHHRRHRPQLGTCMTMGTASTMTSIAEAIGMTLPGAPSIPAVDANHQRMAAQVGGASWRWCTRTCAPRRSRRAMPS